MANFCAVLNVDPNQPGDPREILHFFEEQYEQITTSYMFTFVQESKISIHFLHTLHRYSTVETSNTVNIHKLT